MAILKFKDENNQWQDLAALRGRDGVIQYQAGNGIVIDGNVISAIQQDLSNYYTKSQVNDLIDAIDKVSLEPVNELPATGEPGIIYLVPSANPQTANAKDEYIYINNAWEQIGTTAVDLSNYVTKTELESLLEYLPVVSFEDRNHISFFATTNTLNDSEKERLAKVVNDYKQKYFPNASNLNQGSLAFFFRVKTTDGLQLALCVQDGATSGNPMAFQCFQFQAPSNGSHYIFMCRMLLYGTWTDGVWTCTTTSLSFISSNNYRKVVDLDKIVTTNEQQNISGLKIFNSYTPQCPNVPLYDNQLANKKYVDDAVASAGGSSSLEEEVFLIKTTRGITELSETNPINITDSTVLNELSTKVTAALNTDKLLKGYIQFNYTPPNGGRDFVDLYADYPVSTNVGYYRFYSSPVLSKVSYEGQSIYMIQAVALGNWSNNVYIASSIALTIIKSTFLARDNTVAFTPSADYHPATKKYVDDSIAAIPTPTETEQRVIYIDISSTYTGVLSGDHTYQNITIPTEALAELNALDDISNALIIIHTAYDHVLLNPQSRGTLIDSSVTPKVYGNTYVGTAIRYGSVVPSSPTYTQCCLVIRYTNDPFTLTGTCDFRSKPQEIALKSELHTHANKTLLDTITSGDISDWNDAVTNSHTHSNKTVLDGITAANITAWNKTHIYSGTSTPGAGIGENGDIYVKYTA